MADLVTLVVLLAALAAARWLLWDLRTLPSGGARESRGASVSVIVPARDEEATLPALLASLSRLTVDLCDVVVVDDDSRDATAEVARAAGAVVVAAGGRPPGWTGKAWACHRGVEATSGDLLLFLDADTVLGPEALDGLLELHYEQHGLVSVQPFHVVVRTYEQLSAYFNLVSLLASSAFARHPTQPPMAFGPCLLTSRADYERAGGHERVRGEILDDVRLAAAFHQAGLPVHCAVGGRAIQMRSYPGGPRQMVAGWTKNIAAGASAAATWPAAGTVLWVSAHHAVALGATLALWHAVTGGERWLGEGSLVLWAAAWAAVAWQLRVVLRAIGTFRWWTWALFPLPLLAFDVLFVRSAALTLVRRSVRWRGREVQVGRRGSAGGGV